MSRTSPESSTLKPCPFCGNTDLNTGVRFPHGSSIREPAVRCSGCGVQGPEAAWNRRVGLSQCSQDRNETLRGLAAFFSESVHHVWDKDEIADCLTNMMSADISTLGNSK